MTFSQSKRNPLIIGIKDSLQSVILKESRSCYIYLPQDYYDKTYQPKQYPVLYLLDGDIHFHSVTGLMQILGSGVYGTYAIPEMIVVAIRNTNRTRDLTPTHSTIMEGKEQSFLAGSGGGKDFLKFIKSELIPHIESTYRTMPYRVLVGHSFGGITVINALYTMPEIFNAYVAIDPSLWWDDKILLKKARDYFLRTDLKHKSLFLAQAYTLSPADTINDHFESIKEFATLLESRNYSNIRWKYSYYEDDSHGSVPFIAGYDALRFIFKNYPWRFDHIENPEQLKNQFKDFSEQENVTFLPSEKVIDNMGYGLLFNKKDDLARRCFQLALDLFPLSANAQNSMGEYWEGKRDDKKALECFERSLKINPANEDVKDKIKKLKAKGEAKTKS
jgi:predicted alpha/beta superfamily hydrolase